MEDIQQEEFKIDNNSVQRMSNNVLHQELKRHLFVHTNLYISLENDASEVRNML